MTPPSTEGSRDRRSNVGFERRARCPSMGFRRPRATLDEGGWSELRRLCPARRTSPGVDLRLAERVLVDPKLYSEALQALSVATQLGESRPP